MSISLATILLLHFAALLSLVAAPGEAVAEMAAGENGTSYGLSKEYRAITGDLTFWSYDNDPATLLSQS